MKKYLHIILLSIFFSFLIFYVKNYFFWSLKEDIRKQIEEKYIEPTVEIEEKENKIDEKQIIKDKLINDYESAKIVNIQYIPTEFKQSCTAYSDDLWIFLDNQTIRNKIKNLDIELYKNIIDVRWKMKNRSVKLFWVLKMNNSEFLSVFTHEFGHYIDLYYLEKKVFKDISEYFYEISWKSTKTIKQWLKQIDFVSGYSMTNKYEDFAESFTYYILHNKDFLEKTKKSDILFKKYEFFKNNLFIHKEFLNTNFSKENIKNYYRDITKITYDLKKFLQYIKNWI